MQHIDRGYMRYDCRNGAKFNILKFYSYSTFIHSYSTFVFVFSINICSKFNTYIYIQQFYLFTKLLSIQKLFIHSTTFYSFKIYCASLLRMEVTYSPAADEQGAAKKHKPSL